MSAVVGIYFPDGGPVDRVDLERMVAILAHRGPDGSGVWHEGPAGLGHRMLWTTPESLRESLPLVNQAGDLALTADARLDNRDELIAALTPHNRLPGEISDSELILAAYENWGERCPEKLLGDFAFAIWDKRKQTLFCARDHCGVRPFYYYYQPGQVFVFASELKALFCLPGVPRRLNEIRVAEYLASMFDDTAITFYQHILRLPPAHSLITDRKGLRLQSYWSLDPARELRLGSDEAYAEAFRELFTGAVRCRSRAAFPLGSLLSGGLDSSSITCMAQRLLSQSGGRRLPTFSAVFDEVTECDERPFIHAIVAGDRFEPHYIHGDHTGPFTDVDRMLWHQDEPFHAPGLFLNWKLYGASQKQGVRILLDGHDGDGVVSHGHGYLHELAVAGRWLTLATEVKGLAKVYDEPFWGTFWGYMWGYKLHPLVSRYGAFNRVRRVWRALRQHSPSANEPVWRMALNANFAQRVNLAERYRAWRQTRRASVQGERTMHYQTLTSGFQPFALEVLDKAAAAFSLELRHPFWDKRVVEFCLALPPEQKLHRGWSRLVLRRAMAGILPGKVQWRIAKTDFLPNFSHGLLAFERQRLDQVIGEAPEIIERFVDIPALREMYRRLVSEKSRGKSEEVFTLWKAVSLALWLQMIGGETEWEPKPAKRNIPRLNLSPMEV